MKRLTLMGLVLAAACAKEPTPPTAATPGQAAKPAKPAEPPKVEAKEIAISTASPEALASFEKGRDLLMNVRESEAAPFFQKAVELDPNFAVAHAYVGVVTDGAEGLASLEKANTLAEKLPEAEKTLVEALLAERRGESAKVDELTQKLLTLAPTDWRIRAWVGERAFMRRNFDVAATELKKAAELNPKAGSIHNQLGYASLMQGKKDDAVAAFKKYAEISPTEPNPHDSLGDALMASGKLEEAEAAYKQAMTVAPTFFFAATGVAETRALRGDWSAAEAALESAKTSAPRFEDKYEISVWMAWVQMSAGKAKEAMKAMEEMEKQAAQEKLEWTACLATLERASMVLENGKAKDALKLVDTALARAEKAKLPGAQLRHVRVFGLAIQAQAQTKLGKKADVEKTVAMFAEIVKSDPTNAKLMSMQHHLEGLAALAAKDTKGAVDHFSKCFDEDSWCHASRVEALETSGDKAGADAMREKIKATPIRDSGYIYVRSKLGTIPPRTAAK